MKRQLTDREKVFVDNAMKSGLISKIYKQLLKLIIKKKKTKSKKWAEDLNKHLSKKDIQLIKVHEKILNITNYWRNANQTTLRSHLTPVRMIIIEKSKSNKRWRGCGEKGTLLHCWWEYKLVYPLWRTV